jgi:glycosyltransferase involved in cell wall biosynthesis
MLPIAGKHHFLRACPNLFSRIRRIQPAAMIVYGPIAGCLGGIVARLARVPSVVYSAGYPAYYSDYTLARRARNAMVERISCACADVVWCKSASDVQLYHRRIPAHHSRFHQVPNCVSQVIINRLHELAPNEMERTLTRPLQANIAALRGQWGLTPADVVVGFVGRLVPWKGVDVLLHAHRQVAQVIPQVHLLIVGDGVERANLVRLAEELGIAQRTIFTGEQGDIVPYYLVADVIAVPSREEPFGNVAVEAMAASRPVVASRVGGLADTVVDGVCGYLVPPDDPTMLAEALLSVLQSPQYAQQLGSAARQRALSEYSEQQLAVRLDRLLRIGLARHARAANCY